MHRPTKCMQNPGSYIVTQGFLCSPTFSVFLLCSVLYGLDLMRFHSLNLLAGLLSMEKEILKSTFTLGLMSGLNLTYTINPSGWL